MQNVLIFIKMFIISRTTGQQKLIHHLKFLEFIESTYFSRKTIPSKLLNSFIRQCVGSNSVLVGTE